MKFRITIGIAFVMAFLSACSPSQSELAIKKIGAANALLAKGDTANCLLNLDSIPKLYPKARTEASSANVISNSIHTSRLIRHRDNLVAAKILVDVLIRDFVPEKGEFDKYTSYSYKGQEIDKNWSRSFIRAYLNEKGDLTLSGNYYGSEWLNYTSVTVVGEGIISRTDSIPLDHPSNHHSEFSGSKWEKVTFTGSKTDSMIAMIATNADKKLKAIFKGKSSYIIWVEESDKKAIKAAYELAGALKVKAEAEKSIPILEKKIKI
jgi:hypothetical protein